MSTIHTFPAVSSATRPTRGRGRSRLAAAVCLPLLAGLLVGTSAPEAVAGGSAPREEVVADGGNGQASDDELVRGLKHEQHWLGLRDDHAAWTVQLTLPSTDPVGDDAPVGSLATAREVARRVEAAGYTPRVERVVTPETADSGGDLGYRVRVGAEADEESAEELSARLGEAGLEGSVWFTGWDGPAETGGPFGQSRVNVLTLDPQRFQGTVRAGHGADLKHTETVSELGRDAVAAVNGGFFVFGPEHGAPGDPAGVSVRDGRIISESVGERPALVIDRRDGRARVERLSWKGSLESRGGETALDGLNRHPGKVRNCGGTGDAPTDAPLHDVTCTDTDELVAFTGDYGRSTPTGEGIEAVYDRSGRLVGLHETRGVELASGQTSVQATGAAEAKLRALVKQGGSVRLEQTLLQESGRPLRLTPQTQVINGGPEMMRDGEVTVTPARDGMVRPASPGAEYGWVHQRNPRTIAGVDAEGRLIVATVDGRSEQSWGMSVPESAQLAERLGMVDAVNLDGGGSTAMSVGGALVNEPSGDEERAVGDALLFDER